MLSLLVLLVLVLLVLVLLVLVLLVLLVLALLVLLSLSLLLLRARRFSRGSHLLHCPRLGASRLDLNLAIVASSLPADTWGKHGGRHEH